MVKKNMKKCTICNHERRISIDEALLLSVPLRSISGQFQVSKSALQRHKEGHIPKNLIIAKKAKEICQAEKIFSYLISLKRDAEEITKLAQGSDDLKTALSGIREQSRIIEILAKMQGQIPRQQIELNINNISLSKIYTRLGRKIENMEDINETDR
jgi:hypothetical protein